MTVKTCSAIVSANAPRFGGLFPLLALRSGFFLSLRLRNGVSYRFSWGSCVHCRFHGKYCGETTSEPSELILHPPWMKHNMIPFDIPMLIAGSLEVKLRTIWTDGKAEVERGVREETGRRKKVKRERVRRKKLQAREKVEKSRNTVSLCFSHVLWLCGVEK